MSEMIVVENQSFSSREAAKRYFSGMLERYNVGDTLNEEDTSDLRALLLRHPECDQKVGDGVDHFRIWETEYRTKGFKLVRWDGTETDFSYLSCIRGEAPSHEKQVDRAFRAVVRHDISGCVYSYFREHGDADRRVPCAETGELIALSEAHADHRAPLTFEVLVETFLAARGKIRREIKLSTGVDNQIHPIILDEGMADAFADFHALVARIDIVKASINLGMSQKHRIRPGRLIMARSISLGRHGW